MLTTNLTAVEVVDACIHFASLGYRIYARLLRRVELPVLQARLTQLKKDETDYRKTLRAHRREMFPDFPPSMSQDVAREIIGHVPDPNRNVQDKESLIRCLRAVIRFQEFRAWFCEKRRYQLPIREARIFLEVMVSEHNFHVAILKRQIDALEAMSIVVDERGRAAEALL